MAELSGMCERILCTYCDYMRRLFSSRGLEYFKKKKNSMGESLGFSWKKLETGSKGWNAS